MQFIRIESHILRKTLSHMYRGVPKRRYCQCDYANRTLFHDYNKLAINRINHKPASLSRLYTNGTIFTDPDDVDVDSNLGNYNVRNSLHQDSGDPLTRRINECASVDELFSLLNNEFEHVTAEHASQVVLVLWDLQKIYNKAYLQNLMKDDVDRSPEFMLSNYLNKLQHHKDFRKVLNLLDVHFTSLTLSEASCCLLYLKKMGVSHSEGIMMRLMERCYEGVAAGIEPPPALINLTRITAAIDPKDSFLNLNIGQRVIRTAVTYLDKCNSPEELRLLTFLFHNLQQFVVEPVLLRYKTRLKNLLNTGVLRRQHYPVLLQVAQFLSFPGWMHLNYREIIDICELVAPEIPNMDTHSIISLHKVFQTNLEPAHILKALTKRTSEHITSLMNDDRLGHCLELPHALFCYVTYSSPEKRKDFENILSDYMTKIFPSTVLAIYKTLRYMKTSNKQLCDQFWGKTVYFLIQDSKEDYLLLGCSLYYLYFSSIGQLYRNLYFERLVLDLLMKKFEEGYLTMFPKKLARMGSFILAYGFSNSMHVNDIQRAVKMIEASKDQFGPFDCLSLSRGMQLSSITMAKKYISPVIAQIFHRVDVALTERTQSLASNADLSLSDLSCLVKCHVNKDVNPNDDVTFDLVRKYATLPKRKEQLNSQAIRDIAQNMTMCKVIIPSFFEEIASYIIEAKNRILGDTAYKVLYLYYSLGYSLKQRDMLKVTCDVIDRDKDVMSSLSLLHACCALAYYQYLPESLIKYIFSIQFMERLDAEVQTCYQQRVYPRRLRRQLMQLNRSVCVELPQYRVPWFHQKYLQEQIATVRNRKTHLERSVLETVRSVWPHALVCAPHYSPYGYRLDLLLTLDQDNNIRTAESGDVTQKVAVMLRHNKNFCRVLNENNNEGAQYKTVLNGKTKHQRRHLEILGYKLVEISSSMWYSMHMTEHNVKAEFLKRKIFESEPCSLFE